VAASKHPTINAQLCQQKKAEQTVARKCMHAIMSTAKLLARQGLPFRGHSDDDGTFKQLLLLRSEDIPELKSWLCNSTDFTSGVRQNEMLDVQPCHS